MSNPVNSRTAYVAEVFGKYTEVEERIYFVRHTFDIMDCINALELHPGLQNEVRSALENRKLELARQN